MDEPNEVLSEKTGVADCTEASREASADHDRQAEGRTRRFPFRKARGAAFALAVCAVAAGLTFRIGIGTPSAFGIESIAAICPLGALETMFGARQIMLQPCCCFGYGAGDSPGGQGVLRLDVPRPLAKATLQAG